MLHCLWHIATIIIITDTHMNKGATIISWSNFCVCAQMSDYAKPTPFSHFYVNTFATNNLLSVCQRPQSNLASSADFFEISPRPFTVAPPVPSIHSFQFGGGRPLAATRSPSTAAAIAPSSLGVNLYGQPQQRFQNQPIDVLPPGSGNRYSTTEDVSQSEHVHTISDLGVVTSEHLLDWDLNHTHTQARGRRCAANVICNLSEYHDNRFRRNVTSNDEHSILPHPHEYPVLCNAHTLGHSFVGVQETIDLHVCAEMSCEMGYALRWWYLNWFTA